MVPEKTTIVACNTSAIPLKWQQRLNIKIPMKLNKNLCSDILNYFVTKITSALLFWGPHNSLTWEQCDHPIRRPDSFDSGMTPKFHFVENTHKASRRPVRSNDEVISKTLHLIIAGSGWHFGENISEHSYDGAQFSLSPSSTSFWSYIETTKMYVSWIWI